MELNLVLVSAWFKQFRYGSGAFISYILTLILLSILVLKRHVKFRIIKEKEENNRRRSKWFGYKCLHPRMQNLKGLHFYLIAFYSHNA